MLAPIWHDKFFAPNQHNFTLRKMTRFFSEVSIPGNRKTFAVPAGSDRLTVSSAFSTPGTNISV